MAAHDLTMIYGFTSICLMVLAAVWARFGRIDDPAHVAHERRVKARTTPILLPLRCEE